eukprot:tig00021070_g17806.t1
MQSALDDDVSGSFPRVIELLRAAPPAFVKELEEQWRAYFPHQAPPRFTKAYAAKAAPEPARGKHASPPRRPGRRPSTSAAASPLAGERGGWPAPEPLDAVDRVRRAHGYPHVTTSKFRVFLGLEREVSALEEQEEIEEELARRARSPSPEPPSPADRGSPPPFWPDAPSPALRPPPLAGPSATLRGPGTRSLPTLHPPSLAQPPSAKGEYDAVFGREAATEMLARVLGSHRQFHLDRMAFEASRPSTPNQSLATALANASSAAGAVAPRDVLHFRRMLWKYWHQLWSIYSFYTARDEPADPSEVPPSRVFSLRPADRAMERVHLLTWANDLRLDLHVPSAALDDAFYCASQEPPSGAPGAPQGPVPPTPPDEESDEEAGEDGGKAAGGSGKAAAPGEELGPGRRGAHWLRKNPSFRGKKGRRRASLIGGTGATEGIFKNRRCRFLDFVEILCRLAVELDKSFRPAGPPATGAPHAGAGGVRALVEAAAAILAGGGKGPQPGGVQGETEGARVTAAVERFLMNSVVPLSRTSPSPDSKERKILLSLPVQSEAYHRRRELRELFEQYAGRGRTSVRTDGGITLPYLVDILRRRGMVRPPDPQEEEGEPAPPPPDPDGPISVTEADIATCFALSVRPRIKCWPYFSKSAKGEAAALAAAAGDVPSVYLSVGSAAVPLSAVVEEDPKAERRKQRKEKKAAKEKAVRGAREAPPPEPAPLDSALDQDGFLDCLCRLATASVGSTTGPGAGAGGSPPRAAKAAAGPGGPGGPGDASPGPGPASPHPVPELAPPQGPSPRTAVAAARTSRTGGGAAAAAASAVPAAVAAAFGRAAERVGLFFAALAQPPPLPAALHRTSSLPSLRAAPAPAPAALASQPGGRRALASRPGGPGAPPKTGKGPRPAPGAAAATPAPGGRAPVPVSLFGGALLRV